jgi:hypothetical protein
MAGHRDLGNQQVGRQVDDACDVGRLRLRLHDS